MYPGGWHDRSMPGRRCSVRSRFCVPMTRFETKSAVGVLWAVKEKAKPGHRLTAHQRARNRRFGKVCAKVEHVFRVMKCQFGYRKVRYRGLDKNAAQVFSLLALANLYLARRTIACA